MVAFERETIRHAWAITRDVEHPAPNHFDRTPEGAQNGLGLDDLVAVYQGVRSLTCTILRATASVDMMRPTQIQGAQATVRSLFWLVAGHELHHMEVIAERYLVG